MIKGLYAAASAMLARMNQQKLIAHNVANLDTPGFKQVLTSLEDFGQTPVTQTASQASGRRLLRQIGSLGLGVETSPEATDFSAGALETTGQQLDFAIQGPGFFRVRTPAGERYTRDGRFALNPEGGLVTLDGYAVLDEAGQPITLAEQGDLTVSGDGRLFVNGEEAGQLGLASFTDPSAELARDLPNLFAAQGAPTGTERGVVAQGVLEATNSDPAMLMTQMVQVSRYYEAAQQMVQNQDELLGRTVNSLGQW